MTRTRTSIPELRSYYADKDDREDLGVIDEADAAGLPNLTRP
jgi:hypothetical protein